MKRFGGKYGAALLVIFAFATSAAIASSIKVWSSGEVLTSSDLNTTLAHIHNTMVGGHGTRLVNADVSASAAIAHSKLATPALVPKAWAYVGTTCAGPGDCTLDDSSGVTSVTFAAGAGVYDVIRSVAGTNANAAVLCTCTVNALYCSAVSVSTTIVRVRCFDAAGAATNSGFSAVILDT